MSFSEFSGEATDGTQLRWKRGGTGQAVVLVHGITECAEQWDPIAVELAETFDVIAVDLRGHGASGTAVEYGLESMIGDVATVIEACNAQRPHLVGHSLGGAVVSGAGAALPVASVVNVDQSLQLGSFKAQLEQVEPMLRDAASFQAVMAALFTELTGTMIDDEQRSRIEGNRGADQSVVLGVWDLIFSSSAVEIDEAIAEALSGYQTKEVPYLSLFGIDPGDDYAGWLGGQVPGARVETWPAHGHYPHVVDPVRFVTRVRDFWTAST